MKSIKKVKLEIKKGRGVLPPIYKGSQLFAEANGADEQERESNAQAIVTAVNNTYGKNINPEKIEVLIGVCNELLDIKMDQIEDAPVWFKGGIIAMREALKNIYFED